MSKNRQLCPCGSGKAMRKCCGLPSSRKKIELEATVRRLSQLGMHAEAAQVLTERVRFSPQNPMIWNDIGVEHVAAGQTGEAHEAFSRALKALADYPPSLYNLGRLAMQRLALEQTSEQPSQETIQRVASEAIQYFEASLFENSLQYQSHEALSEAYRAVGDMVQSKLHSVETLKLKPVERSEPQGTWVENLLSRAFGKPTAEASLPFLFSTGREIVT